jgi:hypothetical protein
VVVVTSVVVEITEVQLVVAAVGALGDGTSGYHGAQKEEGGG